MKHFQTSSPDMAINQQRVLPFKHVANFRDLGGYPTVDGQSVKWSLLYRSGHLAKMRATDHSRFEVLNICTLIDFRSESEREQEPNRLPKSSAVKTLLLPVLDVGNAGLIKEMYDRLKNNDFDNFDPNQRMEQAYRHFATDFSEQYKRFIHAILEAQGQPVLWHCTAGKDRTGFASAILLRLLGVPEAIAIEDYLLSGKYTDQRKKLIFTIRLTKGKDIANIIRAFLVVQEPWIRAAFAALNDCWGSFEGYSSEALDLTSGDIKQLRHLLLD